MVFAPFFIFLLLFINGGATLRCHVNIGNEKYIPNKYDVDECPKESEFCFTQATNETGYRGLSTMTIIYGCDIGFRQYCRYGRGCFWMSYRQLICCCPNNECNNGFNASHKKDSAMFILFFIILVNLWS